MRLRKAFIRFCCLGCDRTSLKRSRRAIDSSNLRALLRLNTILIALAVLFGVYYFFTAQPGKAIVCAVFAATQVAALVFSGLLIGGKIEYSHGPTVALLTFSLVTWYATAIWFDTFGAGGRTAVLAICTLLLGQLVFDRTPFENAPISILAAGSFVLCSFLTKNAIDPSVFLTDSANCVLALGAGMALSWRKSRAKLDGVVLSQRIARINNELRRSGMTDALTGLSNRAYAFERFNKLLTECARERTIAVCALIDLDDFKLYNDFFGSTEGDDLLKRVTRGFTRYGEKNDIFFGRINGEEFIAIWKDKTGGATINRLSRGICACVSGLDVSHPLSTAASHVTASVGLYAAIPAKAEDAAQVYFRLADRALSEAKKQGKNRCVRYQTLDDSYHKVV